MILMIDGRPTPLDDDDLFTWLIEFVSMVRDLNLVAGNEDRSLYIATRRRLTAHAAKVTDALLAARRPA